MKKRVPNARPTRGRLRSLRVSSSFRDFILDQLAGVPDLKAKAMFGGIGLYSGDVFFGIVAATVLYPQVPATRIERTRTADATPFEPYAERKSMTYYNVLRPCSSMLAIWRNGQRGPSRSPAACARARPILLSTPW